MKLGLAKRVLTRLVVRSLITTTNLRAFFLDTSLKLLTVAKAMLNNSVLSQEKIQHKLL